MLCPALAPALVRAVDEACPKSPGDPPLWVLLPTRRHAAELTQDLLDSRPSVCGVSLLTAGEAYHRLRAAKGHGRPRRPSTRDVHDWLRMRLAERRASARGADAHDLDAFLRYPNSSLALLGTMRLFERLRLGGDELESRRARLALELMRELRGLLEPEASQLDAAARTRMPRKVIIYAPESLMHADLARFLVELGDTADVVTFDARRDETGELDRRARRLFELDAGRFEPLVPDRFAVFSAQRAEHELAEAAERARACIERGTPPHRIAVVVPRFASVLPCCASTLDRAGVPFITSARTPLLAEPQAHAALEHAASVLLADRRSASSAERCERLLAEVGPTLDAEEGRGTAAILESFAGLGARASLGLPPDDADTCLSALRDSFAEKSLPLEGMQPEGLRLLEPREVVGLAFDRIFLLEQNRDRVPRRSHARAWLSRDDRETLRELGRARNGGLPEGARFEPLLDGEDEVLERERYVAILGAARESLTLSFQRTEGTNRERAPSPWLRRVLRVMAGAGQPEAFYTEDGSAYRAIASSPSDRLGDAARDGRVLANEDALLLAAFDVAGLVGAARELAPELPDRLDRGLAWIRARECFEPESPTALRFDALELGAVLDPARPLRVTGFEGLGRCPLQFFFADVCGIRAPELEPGWDETDVRRAGIAAHAILEGVLGEGKELGALLDAHGDAFLCEQTRTIPALRERALAAWRRSIELYVELDAREREERGFAPFAFEKKIVGAVPLPSGRELRLSAKLDRIDRDASGRLRVIDYKTGKLAGNGPKIAAAYALRGAHLQLPLYSLLVEGEEGTLPSAEQRGVGPEHADPELEHPPAARIDGALWQQRGELLGTLDTLAELCEQGNFPFRKGHHCDYCHFGAACPRDHAPSRERQGSQATLVDWRVLPEKESKA